MYFVYAIYNQETDRIYIGQTNNLKYRLARHNNELYHDDSAYTKKNIGHGKWELVYKEELEGRSEAIKREKQLKSFQGRKFIKNLLTRS